VPSGSRPRLQFAAGLAVQSALPPSQALTAGAVRSSSSSSVGGTRRGQERASRTVDDGTRFRRKRRLNIGVAPGWVSCAGLPWAPGARKLTPCYLQKDFAVDRESGIILVDGRL